MQEQKISSVKLSEAASFVLTLRFLVLLMSVIPALYLLWPVATKSITDEISLVWYKGIAWFLLVIFVIPSLAIVTGLLLKLQATRWLALVCDTVVCAIFVFTCVRDYPDFLLLGIAVVAGSAVELLPLFRSPMVVRQSADG